MLQAMTRENDVKAKQPSTSAEQMEDLGGIDLLPAG